MVLSGDFAANGIKRPEFIYLGLEELDNAVSEKKAASVAKWRTASAGNVTTPLTRLRKLVAVAGGVVNLENGVTWTARTAPADPVLSSGAQYYWMHVHSQKVYMGDGLGYLVFDPRDDTLVKWESEGAGSLPEKCKLAEVYRGRMVLARPEGQPTNWYMSAVDQPNVWDFFPATITVDQAVFGNNAPAGLCPDIVNTLIPHNDDLLIFGCDSSIWLLRGDPAEGGAFDLVSDSTGMAFGRPWCKDPQGEIYFFGSKGGVYRMAPGGLPRYLSDARDGQDKSIQQRLLDIDLSAYRIEMVWDFERQGCHVIQIPMTTGGTEALKSWFWDSKNNAWWEDLPGSSTLQPFSVVTVDGDLPGDRRLVLGCRDGYLREVDSAAKDDDGTAIDSFVTIGPASTGVDEEIMLNRLKAILAKEQDGCTFEVYVSDEPDELGLMVASGTLEPGQNPRLPIRKRGSYLWIKLRNNAADSRWAIEDLAGDLAAMGIRRRRT